MKKVAFMPLFLLIAVLAAASFPWSAASQQSLPEVEYLGQGGTFIIEEGKSFIVKRSRPFRFDPEPGPIYHAEDDERVWSLAGPNQTPPTRFVGITEIGELPSGCQIAYVVIDDDLDGRRNIFFLDDREIHVVEENEELVSMGMFTTDANGILALDSHDSIGAWLSRCENLTPTATATNTLTPEVTATPTRTASPTNEATMTATHTATHTTTHTATPTATTPMLTPTATTTSTPSPPVVNVSFLPSISGSRYKSYLATIWDMVSPTKGIPTAPPYPPPPTLICSPTPPYPPSCP